MENKYPLSYEVGEQQADTINYPRIYFGVSTIADVPNSNYVICDGAANGYLIDYFKNKKKRCEGTFKNGRLIGELIYYDFDARIIEIEHDPRDNIRSKWKKKVELLGGH